MTQSRLHAVASRVLWAGCASHLLALVLLLPYALAKAPAWAADIVLVGLPVLLLVTYVVTFVTAPILPRAERRWTNGLVCTAWFLVALLLVAANVVVNMRFSF